MTVTCQHLSSIRILDTDIDYCEECVQLGDGWIHLRMCLTCGHVGCCDSSKNKHARRHYRSSGDPLVRSIEPGEEWVWCYADEMLVGDVAA